jgi:phosphatidylglycerophosphate synthase
VRLSSDLGTGELARHRVVFAAGDLVLTGDGCDGAGWTESTDGSCAALVDGTVLDLGRAPAASEALWSWLRRVTRGDGERQPPFAQTFVLPPQRVAGTVDAASEGEFDRAIAATLGRPQDPNFPRLTGRRFSKPISRPLARMDVSPNWVTTAAIAVGWFAAWLIYSGSYPASVAGALCLVLSRILDDCDGEVARLTQRQSRFGEIYDIAADIAVYTAVFLALTARLHAQAPDGRVLGAFAVLALGAAATTILILRYVTGTDLPERSSLARRLETTASGDFAYVYLGVALAGIEEWFLYASAVGSHAFWVALSSIALRDRASRRNAATGSDGASGVPATSRVDLQQARGD